MSDVKRRIARLTEAQARTRKQGEGVWSSPCVDTIDHTPGQTQALWLADRGFRPPRGRYGVILC